MADSKITALTALTAADPANDMLPIVDVSDNLITATGTTKRISINNILACSPSATLASATITGAATVGTTLGVTGSVSAGNLNVTNSPIPANGVYLSSTNTLCLATASTLRATLTATGLGLATAPASALSFPIGTVTTVGMTAVTGHSAANVSTLKYGILDAGGDYGGVHVFNTHNGTYSSTEVGLFTGEGGVSVVTERMRVDKSGNVSISTGNVVMATSGKGIDFSATASGSGTMTSELLNDYEEGTWTGTLTGSVSNPTTPVTATGRYTKVGRQVSVSINFESVNTTGASGNVGISGLPFTNNASVQTIGPASIYQTGTFTGSPFTRIDTSASAIEFFASVSNAAYSNVTHNAGTGRFIATSASYTVA